MNKIIDFAAKNKTNLLKAGGFALTIGGSIIASVVSKEENNKELARLVDEKMKTTTKAVKKTK